MAEAVSSELDSLSNATSETIMNFPPFFLHNLMGLWDYNCFWKHPNREAIIAEEMKSWQNTSSEEFLLTLEDCHPYFALCYILQIIFISLFLSNAVI